MKQLHPNSRVWIYQSSRAFSTEEIAEIEVQLQSFVQNWAAHGAALEAQAKIYYQRFIVLMVDEGSQGATGCSIDSSVHFIKALEKQYQTSLFDRLSIAYRDENKAIQVLSKSDFEKALAVGKLDEQTIVFNNLVQTKIDFESKWEVPMVESWHKQLLNQTKINS